MKKSEQPIEKIVEVPRDEHHDLEKEARETQQASVEERIACWEQLLNDSADRQDAMKRDHATLKEQTNELEGKQHSEATREHSEATREAAAREADSAEVRETFGGETLARRSSTALCRISPRRRKQNGCRSKQSTVTNTK